jgi:LysM repeat protein/serine/threonine protein phosphatase PrpC
MKFSSDSIKLKSKVQNEDFCFDIETPRGHLFVVLDFAPHDYANLDATLKDKLKTIVGSFVSLSQFSADLFLGFLSKEINNFLHNLGKQSGGPELLCSAALCFVSGNRLSYFVCGDVGLIIISHGRLHLLSGERSAPTVEKSEPQTILDQLGTRSLETPMTELVQAFTLQEADIALIMTQGVDHTLERQELARQVANLPSPDPSLISTSLMKASAAAGDDRTLVVIAGPYERYEDPMLADLSKTVESLEARLTALTQSSEQKNLAAASLQKGAGDSVDPGQRFGEQLEVLKDGLKGKAARIDLLELDEKLKNLSVVLASKADTADVLGLQRDVLKLGLTGNAGGPVQQVKDDEPGETAVEPAARKNSDDEVTRTKPLPVVAKPSPAAYLAKALLILAIGIAGAFLGGWLQARAARKAPEQWSVRASGNQILISRRDGGVEQGNVTLNVARPLTADGEQTFSSFADVKQYIDTLTSSQPSSETSNLPAQSGENTPAPGVMEITVKSGDSLKRFAQIYNVPAERLMELNPEITRWPQIRIGQKIVVPAPANSPTPPDRPSP